MYTLLQEHTQTPGIECNIFRAWREYDGVEHECQVPQKLWSVVNILAIRTSLLIQIA